MRLLSLSILFTDLAKIWRKAVKFSDIYDIMKTTEKGDESVMTLVYQSTQTKNTVTTASQAILQDWRQMADVYTDILSSSRAGF